MTLITLSLISHTNVGKTTLARTLLRRDIGEVLDQAHVTMASEAHTLIEAEGHALRLWDTPGFGDTARLLRRLKHEGDPIGWFLHQVWDRVADKPLYSSQMALRNVREEADVVLYLLNAAEDPGDAGYVRGELELLSWLGRPVLALLNQTGATSEASEGLEQRWSEWLAQWPVVRAVLPLDAFSRSWLQEGALLEHLVEIVGSEQRPAMAALARAWEARHREVFARTAEALARHLARVAAQREDLSGAVVNPARRKAGIEALARQLERAERELWERVIELHGLEGRAQLALERELEQHVAGAAEASSVTRGALLGGALSGALTGLAADVLSGGLSLGGGMLAGALLGALGGAGISRGMQIVRAQRGAALTWNDEFLARVLQTAVLRYLAVAHFGRGRGRVRDLEPAQIWHESARAALAPRAPRLAELWRFREDPARLQERLEPLLRETLLEALRRSDQRASAPPAPALEDPR